MTLQPTRTARRDARGFSLVEVLIASALLAAVLISISGMFIAGTQSVRSGRELTKATTIANSLVEETLGWNYDFVWGITGGAATDETGEVTTAEATPAYEGDAEDVAAWTATVDRWRELVESELAQGVVRYRVDGVGRVPTPGNSHLETFTDADLLRVTVTIDWVEAGGRQRHVAFEELVL